MLNDRDGRFEQLCCWVDVMTLIIMACLHASAYVAASGVEYSST